MSGSLAASDSVLLVHGLKISAVRCVAVWGRILERTDDVRLPLCHLAHQLFITEDALARMTVLLVLALEDTVLQMQCRDAVSDRKSVV